MSYDDTSFYGDMIVDEYDDKCNFIGTNTPMGYLAYHLLGDGFDLMSDMCSKFMNDFNILTADTHGLDNFWGVSYNISRPLLYEGQRAEYLFIDNGTTASHNDNWNTWSTYTVSRTRNVESTLIEPVDRTTASYQIKYINNMSSPRIIEFDCCQVGGATNSIIFQLRGNNQSVIRQIALSSYRNLSVGEWYHWKVDLVNGNFTNETTNQTLTFSTEDIRSFFFCIPANAQHNLKYKNFKIYKGEGKERPLNDDEYKIYLYLRNCRLITKEDLLINFNKCFGFDDYPIVFSDETFYLEATDHLNYEPTGTVSSNIHKNSEDTTLHFVTDYSNDETTETIESGLTTEEELVTVINIPYNNWDKEFLEMLEQYISIKGNIKIKEYTL